MHKPLAKNHEWRETSDRDAYYTAQEFSMIIPPAEDGAYGRLASDATLSQGGGRVSCPTKVAQLSRLGALFERDKTI